MTRKPFDTSILDAAIAQRRKRHERQRLAVLSQAKGWLQIQGSRYGLEQVYLFGSLICPYRFTDASDVDIAVEQIGPEAMFSAMAALSEAVERDVDLIELSKCPFAHRIRQQGVLWKRDN